MEVVAIILAALGLIVLFISWKKEDPLNEELMTTLKGIAYVRKEVGRLEEEIAPMQSALSELAVRVDRQEQLVLRQTETAEAPAWLKEAREVVEALTKIGKGRISAKAKEDGKETIKKKEKEKEKMENTGQPVKKTAAKRTRKAAETAGEPFASHIYSSVLELSGQGLDVREISVRLGLSQDAVNMVLRTAAGGNPV